MKTTVSAELHRKVMAKIHEGLEMAAAHYGETFQVPVVSYDVRGTIAGKASLRHWRIKLNPILLNENTDNFISRTPGHELAHLIAFKKHRDAGHGSWWKHVMRVVLGQEAARCHNYDVTTIKQAKGPLVKFQCSCQIHEVSQRIATNIRKAMQVGSHYTCKKCKTKLIEATGNVQPAPRPVIQPVVRPVAQPTPRPVTHLVGSSKVEQARNIMRFAITNGWDRTRIINQFIVQAGLTKAGAQTYYNNLKKEFGV